MNAVEPVQSRLDNAGSAGFRGGNGAQRITGAPPLAGCVPAPGLVVLGRVLWLARAARMPGGAWCRSMGGTSVRSQASAADGGLKGAPGRCVHAAPWQTEPEPGGCGTSKGDGCGLTLLNGSYFVGARSWQAA
jgi:hypothetical protein